MRTDEICFSLIKTALDNGKYGLFFMRRILTLAVFASVVGVSTNGQALKPSYLPCPLGPWHGELGNCSGNVTNEYATHLGFSIVYNSQVSDAVARQGLQNYGFGIGRRISIDSEIVPDGDKLLLVTGTGFEVTYVQRERGVWTEREAPISGTTWLSSEGNQYVRHLGLSNAYYTRAGQRYLLSKVVDGYGNTLSFTRDGNVITEIDDGNGHRVVFTVRNGYVTSASETTFNVVTYYFSYKGEFLSAITPPDPSWGGVEYEHNSSGLLLTVKDKLGKIEHQYHPNGVVRAIVWSSPSGDDPSVVSYLYSPTSYTSFIQNSSLTTNISNGAISSKVMDAPGMRGTIEYKRDALNRPLRVVSTGDGKDADSVIEYTYPPISGTIPYVLPAITASDGKYKVAFRYSDDGFKVLSATMPRQDGTPQTYIWEHQRILDKDIVVAAINPNGIKTSYIYNKQGSLLEQRVGDVPLLKNEYDSKGRLITYKDYEGNVTRYSYNGDSFTVSQNGAPGVTYSSKLELGTISKHDSGHNDRMALGIVGEYLAQMKGGTQMPIKSTSTISGPQGTQTTQSGTNANGQPANVTSGTDANGQSTGTQSQTFDPNTCSPVESYNEECGCTTSYEETGSCSSSSCGGGTRTLTATTDCPCSSSSSSDSSSSESSSESSSDMSSDSSSETSSEGSSASSSDTSSDSSESSSESWDSSSESSDQPWDSSESSSDGSGIGSNPSTPPSSDSSESSDTASSESSDSSQSSTTSESSSDSSGSTESSESSMAAMELAELAPNASWTRTEQEGVLLGLAHELEAPVSSAAIKVRASGKDRAAQRKSRLEAFAERARMPYKQLQALVNQRLKAKMPCQQKLISFGFAPATEKLPKKTCTKLLSDIQRAIGTAEKSTPAKSKK